MVSAPVSADLGRAGARTARHRTLHVAGIAVLACPLGIYLFAEILQQQAGPAARVLAVGHHGAVSFAAILLSALFVVGEVAGAQVNRREPALRGAPTRRRDTRGDKAVPFQQHQHDA